MPEPSFEEDSDRSSMELERPPTIVNGSNGGVSNGLLDNSLADNASASPAQMDGTTSQFFDSFQHSLTLGDTAPTSRPLNDATSAQWNNTDLPPSGIPLSSPPEQSSTPNELPTSEYPLEPTRSLSPLPFLEPDTGDRFLWNDGNGFWEYLRRIPYQYPEEASATTDGHAPSALPASTDHGQPFDEFADPNFIHVFDRGNWYPHFVPPPGPDQPPVTPRLIPEPFIEYRNPPILPNETSQRAINSQPPQMSGPVQELPVVLPSGTRMPLPPPPTAGILVGQHIGVVAAPPDRPAVAIDAAQDEAVDIPEVPNDMTHGPASSDGDEDMGDGDQGMDSGMED